MASDSNTFYSSSPKSANKLTNEEYHQQQWDTFKLVHEEKEPDDSKFIEYGTKILKIITIVVVFIAVVGGAVTSKITLFLMISQIGNNTERTYCPNTFGSNTHFTFTVPQIERVTWIWLIFFIYFVPELGTLLRCLRILIFKSFTYPKIFDFLSILVTECLTAIGSSLLIFLILPELDVLKGVMLTNAMSSVPSLEFLLKNIKRMNGRKWIGCFLNILAAFGQISAYFVWPLLDKQNSVLWIIPIALFLISFGWWQNFLDQKSPFKNCTSPMSKLSNDKYFSYAIVAPLKCLLFFLTSILIFYVKESNVEFIFSDFNSAFSDHLMEIIPVNGISSTSPTQVISSSISNQMLIWFVNIAATYACYVSSKFACKIQLQAFNFALPICMSMPLTIIILTALSAKFTENPCVYSGRIPDNLSYLFFNVPLQFTLKNFFTQEYAWIWFIWLFSQFWITRHIWLNKDAKLASTDELFMRPMYDAFLIDQSVVMNRRHHPFRPTEKVPQPDEIPKIFACGTMWHENKNEMSRFLKSILRMDKDQAAGKKKYNWETHIFFDDAFESRGNSVNVFVLSLISAVDEAVAKVYQTQEKVKVPLIYSTPYGGRLMWTLPGQTPLIVHLKDKKKIKTKKRWSQVMYLYYLLGFKLGNEANFNPDRLRAISKNTFILVLDGDIVFPPKSVHMLLEYMKKNRDLAAACGRTHPVGLGVLAWYQIFEYAVGHWMQKATETIAGSVLCAPGCFSMYRTYALLDYNVVARYSSNPTKAKQYIQYDQGEDRWLCTLLLLRGHRVAYCAAADAYTQCPEGFTELYNQRKRWLPSGVVNMFDLLQNAKQIIQINDSISTPYIYYQTFLMICSIIGPGTIFLMMVGGLIIVFQLSQFLAVSLNLVPIVIFTLTCIYCKSDIQLRVAAILSGAYGVLMMMTVVGMVLQIQLFGIFTPSTLFFFVMILQYVIGAILHPKEFYCLKHGLVYFMSVPSMYLLLIIYTVFNMDNVKWGTREVPDEENSDKTRDSTNNLKWYQNSKKLLGANVSSLDKNEETFWAELLQKYLQPFEEDKGKIKEELRELRSITVISFFTINILLVTFLLTLQIKPYYIDWPLDLKYNFRYSNKLLFQEIHLNIVAQQVELISLILLSLFVLSLLIQFVGMLIHRFGTFSLIMANTKLFKRSGKRKYSKTSKSIQQFDNDGFE